MNPYEPPPPGFEPPPKKPWWSRVFASIYQAIAEGDWLPMLAVFTLIFFVSSIFCCLGILAELAEKS